MILLAVDTTLEACQAAVLDGETVLAVRSEPMHRGHQERLAPLVAEVLAAAGVQPRALQRVGVTIGPGSFTGLRVGLAFAKGLALARRIPCVGVSTLAALAASAPPGGLTAAVIDAGRGQVWLQLFEAGQPAGAPLALTIEDAAKRLRAQAPRRLVGSGAGLVQLPGVEALPRAAPDPVAIARLAAQAPAEEASPRPIYLRAPDARLPA